MSFFWSEDGIKSKIIISDSNLIVNNHNLGKIENVTYTVYSSGDIIYKTARSFINIHFYNYLYQLNFKIQDNVFEYYTENKKKMFKIFEVINIDGKTITKVKKMKMLFLQNGDLSIVKLYRGFNEVVLENQDLVEKIDMLGNRFPKVNFTKIKFEEKILKTNKNNFIKHKFSVTTVFNFYYTVINAMFFLSLLILLYLYYVKRSFLPSSIITVAIIFLIITVIICLCLYFFERKIIRSFK